MASMAGKLAMAATMGFGALVASAGAAAGTSVHIAIGAPAAPPVVQVVPVPARQVHAVSHGHGWQGRQEPRGHAGCGAPRWNPHVRYMPGQVVWRHGELWMARPVSARVWNENSPPEWTPKYWVPAVCG